MAVAKQKKKKKKLAVKKSRKPSIALVILTELQRKKPVSREAIQKLVKKLTGRTLSTKNLSWYFSQFRRGLLIGQKPGTHVIKEK